MTSPITKSSSHAAELERLRRELLRRIVANEARRADNPRPPVQSAARS